jgi:LAO/AO transport system kinase
MTVSALTGAGLDAAWDAVQALAAARRESGAWEERRREQAEAWFAHALETGLVARATADPEAAGLRRRLAAQEAAGGVAPEVAAEAWLDAVAGTRQGGER